MLEKLRPMSPNLFAKKVLKSVAKNRAIIIMPSWWRVFWWINRLSPSLGILLAQRHFKYRQKKVATAQKS
jgi:short-subunit dehydrogenase